MFVLSPMFVDPIAPIATATVFAVEIVEVVVAVLRKTTTLEAVVLASFATIDKLSITPPSLAEQSTNKMHPPPEGVFKLVADVKQVAPPTVAKECIGLSTKRGILLVLLVAICVDLYSKFNYIPGPAGAVTFLWGPEPISPIPVLIPLAFVLPLLFPPNLEIASVGSTGTGGASK